MKALTLHGDQWNGDDLVEWEVEAAGVTDFDRALDRLDATSFTILSLQGEGEQHLAIGGGAGQYIVYATTDNWEFWNLMRPDSPTGLVLLTAGGQMGEYPAAQIVGIDQARAAGHAFLGGVLLDPQQEWKRG